MARRRTDRRQRWIGVLWMAGFASGNTLSLSGIESLDSKSIPSICSLAYDTPLRGCQRADFSSDSSCSVRCRLYVEKAEFNIQAACRSIDADPDTLLHKAQKGQLLDTLCDSEDEGTTTTTVVVPRPTKTEETTTEETTAEKTTSEKPARKTTSAEPETTTSVSSEPPAVEPTTSVEETDSPTSTDNEEAAASTTTANSDNSDSLIPGSGGGSPGDFISGMESPRPSHITLCLFAVVAAGLGLGSVGLG